MRPKVAERQQAVALRRRGLSYAEIQARVPVSQASLSYWLRDVPLSDVHKKRLADLKLTDSDIGPKMVRQAKLKRLEKVRRDADIEARGLFQAEDRLWTIGTILYWAEGSKSKAWDNSGRFA